MRICSLFCTPRSPVSPPPKSFDDPDPKGLITTEQLLYMAADEDLISACEYDVLMKQAHRFPPNWSGHHPNIWLPLVPQANTRHLNIQECIQFFITVMKLYDPVLYEPDGTGFSSLIKSIAYR